ncbi:MAG: hypothetical protein SPE11_09695 [Parabacteroides sp.]|nr:hypothetical protein [Parabacteroides sp.]
MAWRKRQAASVTAVKIAENFSSDHVHKKDPRINIQRVNAIHSHFKTFLRKFDGVSTKYLVNYINWFLYLEKKASNTVSFIKNFILEILMDYNTRGLYRQFKANRVLVCQ